MHSDEEYKLLDAFPTAADEGFVRGMECALAEIRSSRGKVKRYRVRRILVFAAVLVLILTAAGFATGLFPSIFGRMRDDGFAGSPATDYEAADALSDTLSAVQTISFQNGAHGALSLEQSYYNGEQLMLGFWGRLPDEPELCEKGDPRFADVEPAIQYADDGHTMEYRDIDIEEKFSAEVVREILGRIERDGWAGIFWYDVYMGDGVYLDGISGTGTSLDGSPVEYENTPIYLEADRSWRSEGGFQRYIEAETPLPAAARNQDELKLVTKLWACPTYYCLERNDDGSVSAYIKYSEREAQTCHFVIPRNGDYSEKAYAAQGDFPDFTADFNVTVTPVCAKVEIENHMPATWLETFAAYDDKIGYLRDGTVQLGEDLVFAYEVWAECAEELQKIADYGDWEGDGLRQSSAQFVLPNGATALIFRPIYANSGAHADEEVRILLGDG